VPLSFGTDRDGHPLLGIAGRLVTIVGRHHAIVIA